MAKEIDYQETPHAITNYFHYNLSFVRWLILTLNKALLNYLLAQLSHLKNKIKIIMIMIINKTQQNSKCRLCGDRGETINHIISECSKLAQKEYKARHDWVGKVIHWEMCKKFKFDLTKKWYMHNPAPVLENTTHKLLWDFNIQTDHLIPARRPDLIIINKRKKRICRLCSRG